MNYEDYQQALTNKGDVTMKKRFATIIMALILVFATSCRKNDPMLLIGVDDSGKEVEVKVDSEKFFQAATETFTKVNESTLNSLESNDNPSWNIDKVEVGVGVNFTVGADQLWKWTYNPGYKLIYQKIQNN